MQEGFLGKIVLFQYDAMAGGVWINGRATGYLGGERYVDYTIKGYDIYKFCTRTNQFLGYKGFKEDKKREWVDLSGRYRH